MQRLAALLQLVDRQPLEVHIHTQLAHVDSPPFCLDHQRLPIHLEVRQRRQQNLLLPRELADPAERRPAVDLPQLDLEQRRSALAHVDVGQRLLLARRRRQEPKLNPSAAPVLISHQKRLRQQHPRH
eukprot:CAMPEP_0180166068 /NCGR_PEP_ID=MMETSP0986-20121125/31350_1 /TAXON_ID=697907 /ORGANISM="non described non described, Strain CCMP2293" /LENGTH=126 /DNA_ID=CAMNT_0022117175 /DNA_START=27 /DNA_END=404 /DNA_ORIENTATION=+